MLGADVGTALMARVLTFDLSWLSPLLILIGVITFLSRKKERVGQLGRVGIGLGLILLALQLIVASAERKCSPSYFYLSQWRYYFSVIGGGTLCNGELLEPCGSVVNCDIKCNRINAIVYQPFHCNWLKYW